MAENPPATPVDVPVEGAAAPAPVEAPVPVPEPANVVESPAVPTEQPKTVTEPPVAVADAPKLTSEAPKIVPDAKHEPAQKVEQKRSLRSSRTSKAPRYMNSYKLDSEKPFNADKVLSIILKVIDETIPDNMSYDPEMCANKAKTVSQMIKNRVKDQDFDRYKLVCIVTIGEKKSYDIFTGVRFLWDSERDRFATHMHENMYIFCVASVFGLYYE